MTVVNSHILLHAVKILDCFSQEQPELGVREVARMADRSSSAAGRLLLSMKGLGILIQNPRTKTYSLGSCVLTWAGVYLTNSDIRITALPYLQELHQSTQETQPTIYRITLCVSRVKHDLLPDYLRQQMVSPVFKMSLA